MDIVQFIKDRIFKQQTTVLPADQVATIANSPVEQEQLRRIGVVSSDLNKLLSRMLMLGADRRNLYTEIEKSLTHPLMGSAVEIYADTSCIKSSVNQATMWCTSTNKDYKYEIDKLFDILNLEESIYDWAWTVCCYGDLFPNINAEPGVGIVSINDDDHPLNTSRLDYNGRLIGFVDTPMGLSIGDKKKLESPWSKVHFRLLGAKKRRTFGMQDPMYTEYRAMSMLTPDNRRLSSKYGTSILNNALTTYKRLKMAEDSLLMARINRSRLRYIYKVAIKEGASPEGAADLINEYISELKRSQSLDTSGAGKFTSKTDIPGEMEDIILPVFGEANNLTVDKIGGDVDIKYIVDIEELRNQLASALRIPLPMLGGYSKEAPPALGEGSLPDLDVRFSRQCYRIQRAMINGVTRLIQIHLAFQGKDPDLNLFEVEMAETSTAAEQQIRDALDKGADVVDKIIAMCDNALGAYDKITLLNYLNEKILKLNDLDFRQLVKNVEASTGPLTTPGENPFKEQLNASKETSKLISISEVKEMLKKETENKKKNGPFISIDEQDNSDLKAHLPGIAKELKEGKETGKFVANNGVWESKYGGININVTEDKRGKKK